MPELPEVETVVRGLNTVLTGKCITAVQVRHKPSVAGSPAPLRTLAGHRITGLFRRGKFIRASLDDGLSLAIHLRMTGWLGVLPASARDPKMDPYERVRFLLDDGEQSLIFRDIRTFGRVWCGPESKMAQLRALSKLGPEPLEIDAAAFAQRLRSRKGRLKSILLNQEFLAGIGNIYADEALFAAGLHPLTSGARVSRERAGRLHAAIQSVLSAAVEAGGSSVENFLRPDGEPGWFQRELSVYGRETQPCKRCNGRIKRMVVGQRGTWFCPACQKRR